jgi:hypothetical protein
MEATGGKQETCLRHGHAPNVGSGADGVRVFVQPKHRRKELGCMKKKWKNEKMEKKN